MKRTIQEQLEQGNITPEEMREAIEAKRRELSEMAAAMGKKGGKKNSPEKSATARENGQKGGRPAKSLPVIDRAQQKIEKNIAWQDFPAKFLSGRKARKTLGHYFESWEAYIAYEKSLGMLWE